jgi:hypothetical protein
MPQYFSFNEFHIGDKFQYPHGINETYMKVRIDFHTLKDGSLLMHSNLPDGLVLNLATGYVGIWDSDSLDTKELLKV